MEALSPLLIGCAGCELQFFFIGESSKTRKKYEFPFPPSALSRAPSLPLPLPYSPPPSFPAFLALQPSIESAPRKITPLNGSMSLKNSTAPSAPPLTILTSIFYVLPIREAHFSLVPNRPVTPIPAKNMTECCNLCRHQLPSRPTWRRRSLAH